MLENKKINVPAIGEEIHVSRIIASWFNSAQKPFGWVEPEGVPEDAFWEWLKELGVNGEDAHYICRFRDCGKLELEHLVRKFEQEHEVSD